MRNDKPVALVTGARRGIGKAIAYALAERGFDLVINDLIEDEEFSQTLEGLHARGARTCSVIANVAESSQSNRLGDEAWNAFGRLDHLINNAGVSVLHRGDLLDVSLESYNRNLDINLRGPFFLTQQIARRMVAHPIEGYRSIVFITSVNAELATPSRGEYCVSKAGLSMTAKLFALKLADSGIGVHEVRPGIIRTDMTEVSAKTFDRKIDEGVVPIRRWGAPEDIGKAVSSLCAGMFAYSTGAPFNVDGGLHIKAL